MKKKKSSNIEKNENMFKKRLMINHFKLIMDYWCFSEG